MQIISVSPVLVSPLSLRAFPTACVRLFLPSSGFPLSRRPCSGQGRWQSLLFVFFLPLFLLLSFPLLSFPTCMVFPPHTPLILLNNLLQINSFLFSIPCSSSIFTSLIHPLPFGMQSLLTAIFWGPSVRCVEFCCSH